MTAAPRFFRRDETELVRVAKENLKHTRDPDDNALDEGALITEVFQIMPFDAVRERRLKAERIIRDQGKPRKTPAEGSLWFPGFETWPYEPNQLVPDGEGKTVERELATPHFIGAAFSRAAEDLKRKLKAQRRREIEYDTFAEWATDQALADRPANEITFGNFVREKGHWRDDPPDDVGAE